MGEVFWTAVVATTAVIWTAVLAPVAMVVVPLALLLSWLLGG